MITQTLKGLHLERILIIVPNVRRKSATTFLQGNKKGGLRMECPERTEHRDWPVGTCKLNTKSCIRDTSDYPCEYYEDYLKEIEEEVK